MSHEEDNNKIIYFTNFGTFKMTCYEQNKTKTNTQTN